MTTINHVFQFRTNLRPKIVENLGVFFIGEREHFFIKGQLYIRLCPLIDGHRTVADLVEASDDDLTISQTLQGLEVLIEKGCIIAEEAGRDTDRPNQADFWHDLTLFPDDIAAKQSDALTVSVENFASIDTKLFIENLRGAGVNISDKASIGLVLVDDYLDDRLLEFNQHRIGQDWSWVPVKLAGESPWIGPLFKSQSGLCMECLAARIRGNRPMEMYIQNYTGASDKSALPVSMPVASNSATRREQVFQAVALYIARWIASGAKKPLDNRLITLNYETGKVEQHPVVQRPQCPVCGDIKLIQEQTQRPVVLHSQPRAFSEDGGYRCVSPEQTYARYRHHIDPITGIIGGLQQVPMNYHELRPVYAAIHMVCPTYADPEEEDFQQISFGKGRTVAQSRTSVMCEAIERWSALFQGDELCIRASFVELGDKAIHPNELLNFSDLQYENRDMFNQRVSDRRQQAPFRFDESADIDWTPVWSLSTHQQRYVPTAYCYNHKPLESERRFCYFNPNGHAAGNCLEEAILQGFLELTERDAAAIWWYNRISRPAVDLISFDEPYWIELQQHYRAKGWDVWILDLTNDLAISTFAALALHADSEGFHVAFGCHLDTRLAIQRALTELGQGVNPDYPQTANHHLKEVGNSEYLFAAADIRSKTAENYEIPRNGDLLDDIKYCIQLVEKLGLEFYVLNQTRPDVGLAIAKVIVPGLRHFWPRFGPGRLYEVPVKLGWLEQELTEQLLNLSHLP